MHHARDYNDLTIEDIERALSFIDPGMARDDWYTILCAIKSELADSGRDVAEHWSKGSEKFNQKDFNLTWTKISVYGKTKIGTLIKQAKDHGFVLSNKRQKVSQEEIDRRAMLRQQEAEKERIEAERKLKFSQDVSNQAKTWWRDFQEASDNHPYLLRKKIKHHNARFGDFPVYNDKLEVYDSRPDALIIPIYNLDGFCGFQGITPVKHETPRGLIDKFYLYGSLKAGTFAVFGKPKNRIIICEGWATGASIHEATDEFVVVAFDAGQLMDKARLMRERFPELPIQIAADNDQFTKDNPGITIAKKVCSEVSNCKMVYPEFEDTTTQPTDFNDLHLLQGLKAVNAYFEEKTVKVYNNQTINFYEPLPYQENDKGKPSPIIENFQEILHRIGAVVRYNVIKKDEEILIPGESFSTDNAQNATIARILSRCAQFKFPTGNISEFLTYTAESNKYNPVHTWVTAYDWDGEDRLTGFLDTIKPKEIKQMGSGEKLHHILIKRWMVSAIASAFSPNGISSAGVLVFQGDQGLGKTKWFKSLVPDELDLTKDGLQLRLDDKDSVKEALSYWLVELGELDGTFNKSEMAALKAFLTKSSDEMRQAYARKASKFARRTVFFASVNPDKFLKDATGNRRYWTIACESIDYNHTFNMQQVWAQVYSLYKSGYGYYLSSDELDLLNHSNEDFNEVDPIDELIMTRLDWSASVSDWKWVTVTEALMSIGRTHPTMGDCRKAGACIRRLNEGKQRKSNGKQLVLCPPKMDFFQLDSQI